MIGLPEKQPNQHIEGLVRRHHSEILLEIQASTITRKIDENLVINHNISSKTSLASLSPSKSTKTLSPKKGFVAPKPLPRKSLKAVTLPPSKPAIKSARSSVDRSSFSAKSRDTSQLKKHFIAESLYSTSVSNAVSSETSTEAINDFKIEEPAPCSVKVLGFRTQIFSGLNYMVRIEVEGKKYVASIWEKTRPGNSQLTGVSSL